MGLGLTLFLLAVLLALLFWVATPRKPRGKFTRDFTRSSSGESGYFLAYGSSAYESTSSKLTKTPDRSDSE
jgi:hypothetical protein